MTRSMLNALAPCALAFLACSSSTPPAPAERLGHQESADDIGCSVTVTQCGGRDGSARTSATGYSGGTLQEAMAVCRNNLRGCCGIGDPPASGSCTVGMDGDDAHIECEAECSCYVNVTYTMPCGGGGGGGGGGGTCAGQGEHCWSGADCCSGNCNDWFPDACD
jgi:hypothetical protein